MNAIKHLPEEQQIEVYKKLCESALRVYANNDEVQSADNWKDIFDAISRITGIKVRKSSKNLRVFTDNAYEEVSMNTNNSVLQDIIKRQIHAIDNGSEKGDRDLKRIYSLSSFLYTH